MSAIRVEEAEDLWPGEMRQVGVGPLKLVFVNVEGELHAYEDRCAHQGVELSRGHLDGRTLTCSAHGWAYDICSGTGLNPEGVRLKRVNVLRRGAEIWVTLHD